METTNGVSRLSGEEHGVRGITAVPSKGLRHPNGCPFRD